MIWFATLKISLAAEFSEVIPTNTLGYHRKENYSNLIFGKQWHCVECLFHQWREDYVQIQCVVCISVQAVRQMTCTCASILMSSVKWNPLFFCTSKE